MGTKRSRDEADDLASDHVWADFCAGAHDFSQAFQAEMIFGESIAGGDAAQLAKDFECILFADACGEDSDFHLAWTRLVSLSASISEAVDTPPRIRM